METVDRRFLAKHCSSCWTPIPRVMEMLAFGVKVPLVIPDDITSVQALFVHPAPPLGLLDAVFLAAQHTTVVYRSVADVLQLSALSVATHRCGFEVPESERPVFRELFDVAIRLEWIDEATREILDDGLTAMTAESQSSPTPSAAPVAPEPSTEKVKTEAAPRGRFSMSRPLVEPRDAPVAPPAERRIRVSSRAVAALLILGLFVLLLYRLTPSLSEDDLLPLEGWIESATGDKITGWAWSSNRPTQAVDVELNDGVNPPITVRADQPRPDLHFVDGSSDHGCVYEIQPTQRDGKTHTFSARIAGTSYTLKGSPQSVTLNR